MARTLEFYFDYGSPYSYLADTQVEAIAQFADGQAIGSRLHQLAERSQAGFVAERTEGGQGGISLHDSIFPEIWNQCNGE